MPNLGIILILLIVPLILGLLIKRKQSSMTRVLIFIQAIMVASYFLPLYKNSTELVSTLYLGIHNSPYFLYVIIGYSISLLCLLLNKPLFQKISLVIYIFAFVCSWLALSSFPNGVIMDTPNENTIERILGAIWMFTFLVIPMGGLLFYLYLFAGKRLKKELKVYGKT